MSLKKSVVSNFILTASNILFPLITFPYITRVISSGSIGKVFFIDSFSQYFLLFSAIGIPYYGVREIAKIKNDKEKVSNLVLELVTIQFTLSLFFSVIFIITHFLLNSLKGSLTLVEIGCISIIMNSFLIEWFYQGIGNFSYITIRSIFIKGLSVLLILFFVRKSDDSNVYYFLLMLTVALSAVLNFGYFLKQHFVKLKFKFEFLKHIRPLLILFGINVSISLYTVMDTIILGLLRNPQDVSFYNVPLRLVKVFWMVIGGVGTVLIPKMSSLFVNSDFKAIQELTKKSLNIVFILAIPFCFFVNIFPNEILKIVSGSQYLLASKALQILSAIPFIIGVCNVFGAQYLLPIGQEKKILYATIAGFVVSILMNILLIPMFGFIGTAIACVLAEGAVCVLMFFFAKTTLKIDVDMSLLVLILTSLTICYFFYMVVHHVLQGYTLIFCTLSFYVVCFFMLQFTVFKNQFIANLLRFNLVK